MKQFNERIIDDRLFRLRPIIVTPLYRDTINMDSTNVTVPFPCINRSKSLNTYFWLIRIQ